MKHINQFPFLVLTAILLFAGAAPSLAQLKTVKHVQQYWMAYSTSTRINVKYSLWNDIHYVPVGFLTIRTGLTRQFGPAAVTGGLAWSLTPVSAANTCMDRKEIRPWAQLYYTLPAGHNFIFFNRLRYEARFRQTIVNDLATENYMFTNRIRHQIGLKKIFEHKPDQRLKPYIVVANEMLLNFGKNAPYTFDQNRLMAAVGLQSKKTQIQIGWMNRFVQTDANRYTLNHTLLCWVTQNFSIQKRAK